MPDTEQAKCPNCGKVGAYRCESHASRWAVVGTPTNVYQCLRCAYLFPREEVEKLMGWNANA
jgi:predicted RNA-binding Zn-ribbon protein involved in translation (DUF1610 family)